MKKLHKADFIVVVEVDHLILSHVFGFVSTALTGGTDQSLVFSPGYLAVRRAGVHIGKVGFS